MENIIETKNLTKIYNKKICVDNLEIHVPKGMIYGLLGRNGAGKTTTMRMLLNLAKPTSGEVLLFGKSQNKNNYKRIGSLIETPGFYENLTGYENLKILAKLRGTHRKDTVEHALKIVGLSKENKKIFKNYSLGMKQRLGIAAAIMHEPELLILDEPINGLDPIGIHEIRQFLLKLSKEDNVTILISSHVLSEIEQIADVIGVMHEGKLIEEVNMDELHNRNRQYVEFEVSDENAAARVLEEDFNIEDYMINENNIIRIYEKLELRGEINTRFVEKNITVTKVFINEEKLEDYFTNIIGGNKDDKFII